jgi:hypothetical protein
MIHKIIATQQDIQPSKFEEELKRFNFSPELLAKAASFLEMGDQFYSLPECPLKGVDTHALLDQIYEGFTPSLKGKALQKSALHLLEVIFDNIPKLLQDPEIIDGIKLKISPPKIAELMIKIHLAYTDKPMTADIFTEHGVETQNLMDHFNRISTKLKVDASAKFPRASHWNVRKDSLWKWCRVMAEETRHPLMRKLEKTLNGAELKALVDSKFKEMFEIITELIMFIAFCDDVSDNLANKELSDIFRKVPFLQEHQVSEEIKKLEKISGGIFKDFYVQSVRVWQDSIKKLSTLVGKDFFAKKWGDFRKLYESIMGSMFLSVGLNLNPHKYEYSIDEVDAGLAPNMMIESFRWMERILIDSLMQSAIIPDWETPIDEAAERVITELVKSSQASGSQSNSMATLYREIVVENDMSNPVIYRLNKIYKKALEERGSTLNREFEQFLKENFYENHFFSDYAMPSDFIDFMMIKNQIVNAIFNELKPLCLTHQIQLSFEDYDSIQEMLTAILPKLKTEITDELYTQAINSLERRLKHITLANQFVRKVALECKALPGYSEEYLRNIDDMRRKTFLLPENLQGVASEYVDSWERFAEMYLLFKHKPGGMI